MARNLCPLVSWIQSPGFRWSSSLHYCYSIPHRHVIRHQESGNAKQLYSPKKATELLLASRGFYARVFLVPRENGKQRPMSYGKPLNAFVAGTCFHPGDFLVCPAVVQVFFLDLVATIPACSLSLPLSCAESAALDLKCSRCYVVSVSMEAGLHCDNQLIRQWL